MCHDDLTKLGQQLAINQMQKQLVEKSLTTLNIIMHAINASIAAVNHMALSLTRISH